MMPASREPRTKLLFFNSFNFNRDTNTTSQYDHYSVQVKYSVFSHYNNKQSYEKTENGIFRLDGVAKQPVTAPVEKKILL
jgi:hypothetical protein